MAFTEFRPLYEKSLIEYIKAVPSLYSKLCSNLKVNEVGDGKLNFVYIVALPYMRCIGESWPMTKERAYFEAVALRELVYHFGHTMSLIGMCYLEPPHIIVRKGLIAGIEYPLLAEHMSEFMARTLYFTSLLYRSTMEHKCAVAEFCGNVELCRLTEQVVFSDPYNKVSQYNHWTSPYLARDAEALQEDNVFKLEVAELKSKFCERAQALLHGDLHTGSVMVTHESTQVLDLELAFYGPMDGHADQVNDRKTYKEWIFRTIEILIHFGHLLIDRRIVDVAHVEDFESITDASRRADCECWALEVAKLLLKERRKFDAIT
ncbi:hypothetical protein RGQ29_005675 [Quercus rubra]|uniref:Aminoglycoside phosphotransferase domain-containing protein n=1 Tax=Quercus rubra TaxID=3512 RepID=A0AAN7IB05_QUERU|nr:hypothetical protein RGQ29_005675 [Quercus rubra]